MGHFYEVRAESDDINFIMYERYKEAEHDKNDPQMIKCADFYYGDHDDESFMWYVNNYCKEHNLDSPYNVTRASKISELYKAIDRATMAYLKGERLTLPDLIISFDGHECVIPIDRTEVVECFERFKNDLVGLYYGHETEEVFKDMEAE